MRILIIKTSSMGDVIHTLPAVTDAGNAIPNLTFDWVVEENFAEIPAWHPLVKNVIPIAWRRWRKNIFAAQHIKEWKIFLKNLRAENYDLIIDAQGLIKSAFFSLLARGKRIGFDRNSAREGCAALCYQQSIKVAREQHAINRVRQLFSQALKYTLPDSTPDYGIDRTTLLSATEQAEKSYLVFLHGTTWATKHWPEEYWLSLAKLLMSHSIRIKLPWGNKTEEERAQRIAQQVANVEVLPKLNLAGIAKVLAGAQAIVAVDTGLGHLAAALNVPTISIYGPTNPALTGALGAAQIHLSAAFPCAPCFNKVCTYKGEVGRNITPAIQPACYSSVGPSTVYATLLNLLSPLPTSRMTSVSDAS